MRFPIFGKQKDTLVAPTEDKKDTSVALTPLGKQKAEQFSLEGPKFDVMATILESGTQPIGEISSKVGMSANKVKEVCKSLARNGYVKFIKVSQ